MVSQSALTVGPMLHINISEKKAKPSFAIEAAYWNYTVIPYSIDMAIEFEKKKSDYIRKVKPELELQELPLDLY